MNIIKLEEATKSVQSAEAAHENEPRLVPSCHG